MRIQIQLKRYSIVTTPICLIKVQNLDLNTNEYLNEIQSKNERKSFIIIRFRRLFNEYFADNNKKINRNSQ